MPGKRRGNRPQFIENLTYFHRNCFVTNGTDLTALSYVDVNLKRGETKAFLCHICDHNLNLEKALKFANQSVKISSTMIEDAKKIVSLLGLPLVEVI